MSMLTLTVTTHTDCPFFHAYEGVSGSPGDVMRHAFRHCGLLERLDNAAMPQRCVGPKDVGCPLVRSGPVTVGAS